MRTGHCYTSYFILYVLYFKMKRFRFCFVASMLLLVSASAFAKELPAKIQAAFEKMYPQAVNVEWGTDGGMLCGGVRYGQSGDRCVVR